MNKKGIVTPDEKKSQTPLDLMKQANTTFLTQFGDFIKDYGVIGLAIGIVIGNQVSKFVNSMVEDLISPLLGFIFSSQSLITYQIGGFKLGNFLVNFIQLIIVLIIVFFVVQYVLKFFKLVEDKKEIEEQKAKQDLDSMQDKEDIKKNKKK